MDKNEFAALVNLAIDGAESGDSTEAPSVSIDPSKIDECSAFDLNDVGNGKRLRVYFGADFLVVRELGVCTWTGTHWKNIGGEERFTIYAQKTAGIIRLEAEKLALMPWQERAIERAEKLDGDVPYEKLSADDKQIFDDAEEALKFQQKRKAQHKAFSVASGNTGKIEGMKKQAAPHVTYDPSQMDRDVLVLNCLNKTLFLHPESDGEGGRVVNVEARDHDRNFLCSKVAPVVYDPKATCPNWLAFLKRFQPREEMRGFLQRFMGYCLTGKTSEQKLLFFYGKGANGKSTFIEALCQLVGDYAGQLNQESITGGGQRRGDQATPDLANLIGARLVRISELPQGTPVKEELIKTLTSGEPMQVRHLNKGFFDFFPEFKAVMSGNDKPFITGTDDGIWRRLLIVPWEVSIPLEERRPMDEIMGEFEAERSGILNWMLEGWASYIEMGLQIPDYVHEQTLSYRTEMDPIQSFIDVCLQREEPDADGVAREFITGQEMYEKYKKWCVASSVKVFSQTRFGRELPKKGIEKSTNTSVRKYLNVSFKSVPEIDAADLRGADDVEL